MKRIVVECTRGIGAKVGTSLVRESPGLSLTGGPSSTHECAGRRREGAQARLVEFSIRGLLPVLQREANMEVIWQRCAGLDVHKDTVVACLRVHQGREVRHEVRQFSTVTRGLLELGDWL